MNVDGKELTEAEVLALPIRKKMAIRRKLRKEIEELQDEEEDLEEQLRVKSGEISFANRQIRDLGEIPEESTVFNCLPTWADQAGFTVVFASEHVVIRHPDGETEIELRAEPSQGEIFDAVEPYAPAYWRGRLAQYAKSYQIESVLR